MTTLHGLYADYNSPKLIFYENRNTSAFYINAVHKYVAEK